MMTTGKLMGVERMAKAIKSSDRAVSRYVPRTDRIEDQYAASAQGQPTEAAEAFYRRATKRKDVRKILDRLAKT